MEIKDADLGASQRANAGVAMAALTTAEGGGAARGRLAKLREQLAERGIDAYVVTNSDTHASEYVAEHWKARSWLSGFTGSNGTLVVTAGEAALWTDGRYYIQAAAQLAGSAITLMRGGEPGTPEYPAWIAERVRSGAIKARAGSAATAGGDTAVIGVDGRTTSCFAFEELVKAFDGLNVKVTADFDAVGEIWQGGRPDMPSGRVFGHELRYAGDTVSQKLASVRGELTGRGATHAVICGLEDVAWLLNIRGGDIRHLPVAYAFVLVSADTAELFIDPDRVPDGVARTLADGGVCIACEQELASRMAAIGRGCGRDGGDGDVAGTARLTYDPHKLNRWLLEQVPPSVKLLPADEPTILLKGIKNAAELRGHRECQLLDGAAMVRFLIWLERAARERRGELTEWDASIALHGFRKELPGSRGDSFNTIAGFGPNGAMMHYAPTETASSVIGENGLMVVDSGGQYPGGTTDITRTVVFGSPTPEERRDFTLTLKSHIALASARFLYGATGAHLDSIARKVMWDHGLDYKCGTGHGVGCYLSVHEGPHSISMRATNTVRLEENMIVSIEPGVYREGKHGVRIENLALVTEDFTNEFGRFMRFETLSFCPVGLAGIDAGILDEKERGWLNGYHAEVYERLSPQLTADEREWLAAATRAI